MPATGAVPATGFLAAYDAPLLIDGRLRQASDGGVFDNVDPFTERVLGTAAEATSADAREAVAAARRAADTTSWADDHGFRARCLRQLHEAMDRHREELRAMVVSEVGCPISMTRGLQLDQPLADIPAMAELAERYTYERALPRGTSGAAGERLLLRRPQGVVVAITPYNYPIQNLLIKLVPALAAGNTVVAKPSPLTPWCATFIGRLVAEETDIPAGVVNILTGTSVEMSEQLVADPDVDMIAFTGSTAVGRSIMASAAGTVKKTVMELGGKSPHLILPDADVPAAVRWGLLALFRHAGQGCSKLTRVLLPRSRYEEGLQAAAATAAEVAWGDPWDERNIMGPLIGPAARDRALSYTEKAVAEGARILTGGRIPQRMPHGYFLEPTIVCDVGPRDTIAQEEIFGPVAAVLPYDDVEDGVRIANDTVFGLSGGVWGGSVDEALAVARRIRSGTMTVNGSYWYGNDTPFGGVKQSGLGRELGVIGFEEFLDYRVIGHPAS
ncbi:hypothetical protein PZ61_0235880 [Streptomyces sp. MNU77]|nr:hypothetical protein PZ61_0235880 [Streptomyces sp. MNU77]